jgi:ABC-type Mn2+/Zn2+ transport system permease subunit
MMICVSVLSAVVAAIAGLFISYFLNVAAGATIVLTLTVLFGLALAVARNRRPAPIRHGRPTP